ncbi:hypothetical protein TPHA_0B03960 [Tetrapisispora phaffii CBS 4417]|uniref:SEC7 domain-containing protein n=1 Tax=Tetrapisispora phaffii (strain ATCC 24235 / CBS 4417 / NBRC 1672 / NRRL Y-8282 / UCD 70-5) TaxID=1071381 RepID=G8BPY7_TETPH|nr:hypothetical protein TPHA_0B03960 [Tetrapisispora phaffii CBS 4417]CCE62068.1 hypothetical protein TPHA_0B03960 [Tetrapisispora phaffii CBS 4417]
MVYHIPDFLDSRTLVIRECIRLSNSMRKHIIKNDYNQLGMSVVIGTGNEFFTNAVDSNISINNGSAGNHPFNYLSKYNNMNNGDQLISKLLALKKKLLSNEDAMSTLSPVEILEPFLFIIVNSSVPGDITVQALETVGNFFSLKIAFDGIGIEYVRAYTETIRALTHCRFERSSSITDNSVLLKVVDMLQTLLVSPNSNILPDGVIYEVLQIILSMVCNTRRTEILRKAAETSLINVTTRVFSRLADIEASESNHVYINSAVYAKNKLKKDTIGTSKSESSDDVLNTKNTVNKDSSVKEAAKPAELIIGSGTSIIEDQYGLPVIIDYLNLLLSLILPEKNENASTEATLLSLKLLKIVIDISGTYFLLHPRLFAFVSDPIFKSVLYIIQNSENLLILQAVLELFATIYLVFGNSLQRQIELTLNCLLQIIYDKEDDKDKKKTNAVVNVQFKELIMEQLSVLWTCSPSFFMSLFAEFDCDLDNVDISLNLINALINMTVSDNTSINASVTIPSISLDGVFEFVEDIYDNIQCIDKTVYWSDKKLLPLLEQREQKTVFIESAALFNKKPKEGISLLLEKGFISSDTDEDIAKFLFENNTRMNKKTIGLLLSDPDKKSLLNYFIGLYDFNELRVDEALRILLTKFRLPGESQQIERIIECFAQKYVNDHKPENKNDNDSDNDKEIVNPDLDSVFVLSYSIIMLNTDLHNPQVKEHMTFEDYSNNLKGCYNSKDFPHWYLDKIYCSIRDKEIIMPEEHHGNKKWFDDAWNNIISSTLVVTENTLKKNSIINNLSKYELAQLNEVMFSNVGIMLVEEFTKIILGTKDPYVFSKVILIIEKCLDIACFFNLSELYTNTLRHFATYTGLITKDDDEYTDDSVVEIYVESSNTHIPVSRTSIQLGEDFKKQQYLSSFFRIIRKNNTTSMLSSKIWETTLALMINLYEKKLIDPDVFHDFQKQLCIGNLPKPKPAVVINKERINRGILSAFASYLKGDEEPSDDEIETALNALECIKKINVTMSVFGIGAQFTPEFIELILKSIKTEITEANKSYFETEALFLIEITIALYLHCKDISKLGDKILDSVKSLSESEHITKKGLRRLVSYKLLLLSILMNKGDVLKETIDKNLLQQNEIFNDTFFSTDQGEGIIKSILLLAKPGSYRDLLYNDESFWQLLRNVVSNENHLSGVFDFINSSISNDSKIFTEMNFKWILGLLDEISSAGAIGNKWEINKESSAENPQKHVIETSIKSLFLTQFLFESSISSNKFNEEQKLSLIQALSHQCLNPCSEISNYAIQCIGSSLTKEEVIKSLSMHSIQTIIREGLMPLLELDESDNIKENYISDIIKMISKVYLINLRNQKVTTTTFDQILSLLKKYESDEHIKKEIDYLVNENTSYLSEMAK